MRLWANKEENFPNGEVLRNFYAWVTVPAPTPNAVTLMHLAVHMWGCDPLWAVSPTSRHSSEFPMWPFSDWSAYLRSENARFGNSDSELIQFYIQNWGAYQFAANFVERKMWLFPYSTPLKKGSFDHKIRFLPKTIPGVTRKLLFLTSKRFFSQSVFGWKKMFRRSPIVWWWHVLAFRQTLKPSLAPDKKISFS